MTARQKSRLVTRQGKGEAAQSQTGGSSPRFSVILCTYNRRNLALSALASLRRQTLPYSAFEVIVIDNGSNDGTLSAVRTYVSAGQHDGRRDEDTWKVLCLSETQNGLAYARNTGLLAASGDIAVFLDDDTIADPYFLERLLDAYEETDADAIGARVDIRWEAARPHWLSDDLQGMLGAFAPGGQRAQLDESTSFSSSAFSVKVEALRAIGYFSPFLSKRIDLPASAEVRDMCQRLREAGYTLWFEPGALVMHRAPAARLKRSFLTGRAYWQGRSDVMARYRDNRQHGTATTLSALARDLREIAFLALIHRPLLRLAGRPTSERLQAAMEQARHLGHLQQRLAFLEHAPTDITSPTVFVLRAPREDMTADLFIELLHLQDIRCVEGGVDIPLAWLWQHRAYRGKSTGILHFYAPGAFDLTHRQRQRLSFRLWLAHRWGVRLVTTDTGGWWQSTHGLRFLAQRALERQLMQQSQAIIGYTRQPDQLYLDKKLRRKLRSLPHPGFLGALPAPVARDEARKHLAFPEQAGYTYLCLAAQHTERELLRLVEAARKASAAQGAARGLQLLLVGAPCDKRASQRLLKLAALNPFLQLFAVEPDKDELALYMGAVDALVIPHFAVHSAGKLETAMLALSYGRVVVAPNLPRFCGMLPPRASVLYDPASPESLARALLEAQQRDYQLSERDREALNGESGWGHYVDRLTKVYKEVLQQPPR